MTVAPVRLAIVGCGKITTDSHLPAALMSSRVEVKALVDREVVRAERLAVSFGIDVRTAERLDQVLDSIDGVVVATPNHAHGRVAETAVRAGKPVLVEKPLATRLEEAEELCRHADAKSLPIAVGFVTRFYPNVMLLKSLLERRYLGRLEAFSYEFGTRGGWAPVSGYNLDRKQAGGGVLVVTGAHFLDRMLYLFGRPSSFVYRDDNHGGVEANCYATMQFDNEQGRFTGELLLSKTQGLKNRLEIRGSEYVCEHLDNNALELKLFPRADPDLELTVGNRGPIVKQNYFQAQLEDFAAAIIENRSPRVDGWQGARSVALTEEMYARRGQLEEPWLPYTIGVSAGR